MKLPDVYLLRDPSTDEGTLGRIVAPGFSCRCIEPPWKGNQPEVSCIPEGVYLVAWVKSPKYGWVYSVQNVPARTVIRQHPGNWAGDASKGFRTNSLGCQLFGAYAARIQGQMAVVQSRKTHRQFADHMGRKPYCLIIKQGSL